MSGTLLAGIASLTINGDAWDVVSDAEYRPSGLKLEVLKGQTRVEGFSGMPQEGFISATLRDRGDAAVAPFIGMMDVTVVLQMANGKTVYGDGMGCTDLDSVKTQEGTFTVRFDGGDVSEITV